MTRQGRPERNRTAGSFRQLRRFHHASNSDKVFGTHKGSELEVIQDVKLLRGIFTRLLLAIADASNAYYDYASLNFPIRPLADPPETRTPSGRS
jgi:hypothetical protein